MRLQVRGTRLWMPGSVLIVFDVKTMLPLGTFTSRRIAEDFMVEMARENIDVMIMQGKIK